MSWEKKSCTLFEHGLIIRIVSGKGYARFPSAHSTRKKVAPRHISSCTAKNHVRALPSTRVTQFIKESRQTQCMEWLLSSRIVNRESKRQHRDQPFLYPSTSTTHHVVPLWNRFRVGVVQLTNNILQIDV